MLIGALVLAAGAVLFLLGGIRMKDSGRVPTNDPAAWLAGFGLLVTGIVLMIWGYRHALS